MKTFEEPNRDQYIEQLIRKGEPVELALEIENVHRRANLLFEFNGWETLLNKKTLIECTPRGELHSGERYSVANKLLKVTCPSSIRRNDAVLLTYVLSVPSTVKTVDEALAFVNRGPVEFGGMES